MMFNVLLVGFLGVAIRGQQDINPCQSRSQEPGRPGYSRIDEACWKFLTTGGRNPSTDNNGNRGSTYPATGPAFAGQPNPYLASSPAFAGQPNSYPASSSGFAGQPTYPATYSGFAGQPNSNRGSEPDYNEESLNVPLKVKRYFIHKQKGTWHNALSNCKAEGRNLAIMNERREQDQLYQTMRRESRLTSYLWLAGITNSVPEFTWFYGMNTSTKALKGYSNWKGGFPKFSPENRSCLKVNESTGKWENADCEERMYYVCEEHTSGEDSY